MAIRWPARRIVAISAANVVVLGLSAVLLTSNARAVGASPVHAALATSAPPSSQPARVTRSYHSGYQVRTSEFVKHARTVPLPTGQAMACPAPAKPGQMQCMAIVGKAHARLASGWVVSPDAVTAGYSPASLRSAYNLSKYAGRGAGETVAIVDAYRDPKAAANLATYRSHYHLPACTTATKCLRIVNQLGQASSLPAANSHWALEESLDLDMVSAICPRCRILLVEARNPDITNLGVAENTAVRAGARFVTNSWNSGSEFLGEQTFDHYFNHPGVAITFAAGDSGYGTAYPTDSQFVTAVGGTVLKHARNSRGWSEAAWSGTGSGCAILLAKAAWQTKDDSAPNGCLNRTGNDVAADAAPATGVAVYDTYNTGGTWLKVGGTSVATPLIAAVYALAGKPSTRTYPAAYPYQHATHFYGVTGGSNGTCEPNRQYLCHGRSGYDGPTGLGTPNGIGGFSNSGAQRVTLLDPGVQDVLAGAPFSLRVSGLDTSSAAPPMNCTATNLPSGLTIASPAGSANCQITGTLPASPGTYPVTVIAMDTATGQSAKTAFRIVVVATDSLTTTSPTVGAIRSNDVSLCLDSGAGTAGTAVVVSLCSSPTTQNWAFVAGPAPGGPGELTIGGNVCLGLSGTAAVLDNCGADPSTGWTYLGRGMLANQATDTCLNISNITPGSAVVANSCSLHPQWNLPRGQITSGIAGLCLDNTGDTPNEVQASNATCGTAGDTWTFAPPPNVDWLESSWSTCALGNGAPLDNVAVTISSCVSPYAPEAWLAGPGGELINAGSGLCLADPADNATSGTGLELEDCYGAAGEIWAFN